MILQTRDLLVMTKPLGTGIISTAIKRGISNFKLEKIAIDTMRTLNKSASEAMGEIGVNACTDITGYGLLGHLLEMCEASNVSATIEFNSIPYISGVLIGTKWCCPWRTKRNLDFVRDKIENSGNLETSNYIC